MTPAVAQAGQLLRVIEHPDVGDAGNVVELRANAPGCDVLRCWCPVARDWFPTVDGAGAPTDPCYGDDDAPEHYWSTPSTDERQYRTWLLYGPAIFGDDNDSSELYAVIHENRVLGEYGALDIALAQAFGEVCKRLVLIRVAKQHGDWEPWVESQPHLGIATVRRYVRVGYLLYRHAGKPINIDRFGKRKLELIATLDELPDQQDALLNGASPPTDTGRKACPSELNCDQFAKLVRDIRSGDVDLTKSIVPGGESAGGVAPEAEDDDDEDAENEDQDVLPPHVRQRLRSVESKTIPMVNNGMRVMLKLCDRLSKLDVDPDDLEPELLVERQTAGAWLTTAQQIVSKLDALCPNTTNIVSGAVDGTA